MVPDQPFERRWAQAIMERAYKRLAEEYAAKGKAALFDQIKNVQPGELRHRCREGGLEVVSIRRLRIGRVALAKVPVGQWRYLPPGTRF